MDALDNDAEYYCSYFIRSSLFELTDHCRTDLGHRWSVERAFFNAHPAPYHLGWVPIGPKLGFMWDPDLPIRFLYAHRIEISLSAFVLVRNDYSVLRGDGRTDWP